MILKILIIHLCFIQVQIEQPDSVCTAYELIAKGSHSSEINQGYKIVTSETELADLKRKIHSFDYLEIDYSKEMLIAIFKGRCNSGGHSIRIDTITYKNQGININVVLERPGYNCKTTKALTYPFAIYKLRRTNWVPNIIYTKISKPCK